MSSIRLLLRFSIKKLFLTKIINVKSNPNAVKILLFCIQTDIFLKTVFHLLKTTKITMSIN